MKKNILCIVMLITSITSNICPMFDFDPMHVYDAVSHHLTNLHESFTNLMQAYHNEESPEEAQQREDAERQERVARIKAQRQERVARIKAQRQKALNDKLHDAIRQGDTATAQRALENGADPNAPADGKDNTSLHLAAGYGRSHIAKLLIKHGADKMLINKAGKTAQQIADSLPRHSAPAETDRSPKPSQADQKIMKSIRDYTPKAKSTGQEQLRTIIRERLKTETPEQIAAPYPQERRGQILSIAKEEFNNTIEQRLTEETPEQIGNSYLTTTPEERQKIQDLAQHLLDIAISKRLGTETPETIAHSYATSIRELVKEITQNKLNKNIEWQLMTKAPAQIADSYPTHMQDYIKNLATRLKPVVDKTMKEWQAQQAQTPSSIASG